MASCSWAFSSLFTVLLSAIPLLGLAESYLLSIFYLALYRGFSMGSDLWWKSWPGQGKNIRCGKEGDLLRINKMINRIWAWSCLFLFFFNWFKWLINQRIIMYSWLNLTMPARLCSAGVNQFPFIQRETLHVSLCLTYTWVLIPYQLVAAYPPPPSQDN